MQAGLALAGRRRVVIPRAEFKPAPVLACPEYEDVSLAKLDALSALALLELGPGPRLAGLEPLHAAQLRDVEQHAAADDALVVCRDVLFGRTVRTQHVLRGSSVVGHASVREVA